MSARSVLFLRNYSNRPEAHTEVEQEKFSGDGLKAACGETLYSTIHEQASFSLAVPGPLGGGRVFLFPYAVRTYDDFRAPNEGAGHLVLPPIACANYQAIFQISPSRLNKTRYQYAKSPVVLRSLGSDEVCPAGRSSPKTYQTRQAWASFVRATDVTRHGTAAWTWLHSSRAKNAFEFRRNRMHILLPSTGGAETVVRVTVRRGVPVTVRRADVRRLIVERPAPEQTRVWPPPAGSA